MAEKLSMHEIDQHSREDDELRTSKLGRSILRSAHNQPIYRYPLHKLSAVMLKAVSRDEQLKKNLMRFVDVYPTLNKAEAVTQHLNEYLGYKGSPFLPLLKLTCSGPQKILLAPTIKYLISLIISSSAKHFIAGADPQSSLPKLLKLRRNRYAYTVDLLGEFTTSHISGIGYAQRYLDLIDTLATAASRWKESEPLIQDHTGERNSNSVSVKLSALAPNISPLMNERSKQILRERLSTILERIRDTKSIFYLDAEDSSTNYIIYEIFTDLFSSDFRSSIEIPGIVVQAYLKNSEGTLLRLIDLAKKRGSPIAIRLVKGAYWDSEVILARQNGLEPPVFMKKFQADRNYEKLTDIMLRNREWIYPAFGSHNIRSLSNAVIKAESYGLKPTNFELQALYGMGEVIGEQFKNLGYLVRFYVPVGNLIQGMGYLVRRLLENTANESFLRLSFLEDSAEESLLSKPAGE